ncbi:antirepressor [Mycobacterium phage Sbash]|uniref:Antirepressor n=1 Tax=Mycobacterium phage Sbash TaxID=1567475 RepID=A0A0A7S2C6_9CAUD|nr:antirepressor [Mycobacterium phage Sbash]AJA43346.1 antirepressor [Mycobacterium phage Sbash]
MDLTDADARSKRDQLVGRVDVIDKVGVLRCLPGDVHATTDMVAEFYEVPRETVLTIIKRNRDELDDDGFAVVSRSEVTSKLNVTPNELGMPRTAPSLSLFPRRAVLRIGMLLRDSPVARRVRDYLLETESGSTNNVRFLVPKTLPEALRLAADQYERAELAEQQNKMLEARIEKDAPLVAKAEAHSSADNASVNRQTFAREVQQWGIKRGVNILHEHVYELLRRKGMLVSGDRSDRNHATAQAAKAGWAWTKKDVKNDHATATTYIRPRGQDLAWKWITEHVATYGDLTPRGVA